jgi:hypothetical protein
MMTGVAVRDAHKADFVPRLPPEGRQPARFVFAIVRMGPNHEQPQGNVRHVRYLTQGPATGSTSKTGEIAFFGMIEYNSISS